MTQNVLLITVDSLRYDTASRLRNRDSTLGDLADRGTWYSRAYATGPGTTPSFPALLTGTLPLSYEGLGPLAAERPRISTAFQQDGYETAAFHCNPFLSDRFGYDEGFETFEDYQHPLVGVATRLFPRGIELQNPTLRGLDERLGLTDAMKRVYQFVSGKPRPYVSADVITQDALAWLDGREQFFCWVHYMDVHHPCYPPEPYRAEFGVQSVSQDEVSEWYSSFVREPEQLTEEELETLESLYEAAVAYTDDQIGQLISALAESGQLEQTVVVYTSDHGELFGEHGEYGKPERMYDELLHVPLVVVNDKHGKSENDNLVSLLDVPPLIHEAAGVEQPEGYQGRLPTTPPPRTHVLAEHEVGDDVIVGGRTDDQLYEVDGIRDENWFFDITGEKLELLSDGPQTEEGERLVKAVRDRHQEVSGVESTPAELPEDVEQRLEQLGYR